MCVLSEPRNVGRGLAYLFGKLECIILNVIYSHWRIKRESDRIRLTLETSERSDMEDGL